jgi:hypothetical protein
MNRNYIVVLGAVGIGICAAVGVGIASQVVLSESLETSIDTGVRSGLIATLLVLGAEYTRENVL